MKLTFTRRTASMLTWILLLIAVPVGFYVSHVYNQLGQVRENNLRTLSKAANSTREILSTSLANVENLVNNPEFICEFERRQPYLTWGGPGTCNAVGAGLKAELQTTEQKATNVKFAFQNAHLETGPGGVTVVVPRVTLSVSNGRYEIDSDEPLLVFQVAMRPLLAAIPFSDALDLLFIADENGDVVHQYKPTARRDVGLVIGSLDGLVIDSDSKTSLIANMQRASSINSVSVSGVAYQLLCQPLMFSDDESGEQIKSGESRGSRNWLLCGLVESDRSYRQSLAVAPFLAFMFFAVTVFGFLTWPAIKLLWMTKTDRLYFVDLCFLLFGTLGALMLVAILIFGVGSHKNLSAAADDSLRQLASRLEYNLNKEIDHLTRALSAFDNAIVAMLDGSDRPECSEPGESGLGWLCDVADFYSGGAQASLLFDTWKGKMPESGDDLSGSWPIKSDFQMVFWTDCLGHQLFKATSFDENTPRVDVRRRQYIQAAIHDRLWHTIRPDGITIPRYVESVRSITTGKFATVISIRSNAPIGELGVAAHPQHDTENCRSSADGVAALQAALVATTNAVLPPGVGFAIVDKQGIAILHSDERRALFENLYEEMKDGDQLQSIIVARAEDNISTNYLGKPHRVFVKPLADFPWSVVAFADTELISTANLEIIGHAALLTFLFLLLYVVLAAIYFAARGPEVPLWFWPGAHGGPITHWALTIPIVSLVSMILLIVLLWHSKNILLPAVFLMPLAIFIAIWSAYHWYPQKGIRARYSQDVKPEQLRSSLAASILVWIVIAILPASVFFAFALENQASLLVRYENEYLAAKMVERNCAIDDYYRAINRSRLCSPDVDSDCLIVDRRSASAGDLYPSAIFWPGSKDTPEGENTTDQNVAREPPLVDERIQSLAGPPGECQERVAQPSYFWSAFRNAKPIYNSTVLRSRYLSPNEDQEMASNACWSWVPATEGSNGEAEFLAGPLPCNTTIKLLSGPPLSGLDLHYPAVGFMGALLLLLLYFWTRYGVRNLFFGDLRMPSSQLRDVTHLEERLSKKSNDSKVRIVAVAASQNDRASLLRQPQGLDTSKQGHHNRYDMLDYVSGSAKRNDLLENLVRDLRASTNILIVSPLDPYSLLDTDAPVESADPNDTAAIQLVQEKQQQIHRWHRILSKFRIVIVSVNESPPTRVSKGIWQRELDRIVKTEWLDAELKALPELESLRELLSEEVIGSTRRNALDRIVERAFGSYTALWDACTEDEKLVLVQIAFENVVNPKQVAIIRRLMQRGLLVRDPALRIMNQSFARFIVQVQIPAEVKSWERATTGLSWAYSRWALFAVLLVALLFLWATQRELFNMTITFLTAAAVGLPGLVKVLSSLNRLNVEDSK